MKEIDKQRTVLAQKAAQIIAENGITDYAKAKHKALEQLGYSRNTRLPGNKEIEAALKSYLETFDPDLRSRLNLMRETAVRAMKLLNHFNPQLTGSVLSGTASRHHPVELFVTAQSHEEIARCLMDHSIPFQNTTAELKTGKNSRAHFHGFQFEAGEITVRLTVISGRQHLYPTDPTTGFAPDTASLCDVRELLELAKFGF